MNLRSLRWRQPSGMVQITESTWKTSQRSVISMIGFSSEGRRVREVIFVLKRIASLSREGLAMYWTMGSYVESINGRSP